MPRNCFWNPCRTQELMCREKVESLQFTLTPPLRSHTAKACTANFTEQRTLRMLWGLLWDLGCCVGGDGGGGGPSETERWAYPRLQSRVLTHHNQEAVVILQGCWSSVFCRESDIPVLEHKTDRVCTTQFSGDSVSLLPEGHSHFHPASILDACWIFLEANPNN